VVDNIKLAQHAPFFHGVDHADYLVDPDNHELFYFQGYPPSLYRCWKQFKDELAIFYIRLLGSLIMNSKLDWKIQIYRGFSFLSFLGLWTNRLLFSSKFLFVFYL
jgi:hypothetical protein